MTVDQTYVKSAPPATLLRELAERAALGGATRVGVMFALMADTLEADGWDGLDAWAADNV